MTGSDVAGRYARAAARWVTALWIAAVVGGAYLTITAPDAADHILGPWIIPVLAFSFTGSLITLTHHRHTVGWCFLGVGVTGLVTIVLSGVAVGPLGGTGPAPWVSAVADSLNTAAIIFLVPIGMLVFPDGRLPSRRWAWFPWAAGVVAALGAFAALALGGWGGDPEQALLPSPLRPQLGETARSLTGSFLFPAVSVLFVASSISLVLRYRSSRGVEREQLTWIALAGALTLLTSGVLLAVADGNPGTDEPATWALALAFASLPAAAAVAILRHRLYDIDVVVSRTVTFSVLAGFITAVYAGIVAGIGSLFGAGEEPSLLLSVAATAVVAVAFEPVRARVTRWVNRLVFGRRATPYEVMAELTARLSEAASWEQAVPRLARLVVDGTGAPRSSVWLRVGDELRLVATAPDHPVGDVPSVVVEAEELPGLPGTVVEPVTHGGELLGAIAVDEPRNGTLTPADAALVADAAAGAALLFRNLRLNAELADRAAELRVSRRRLVASHDQARRKLERDLHDGAQQEVVALKVKLGLARTLAQREGADDVIATIEQLAETAQDSVETMRTIARGIYPPLLEAEGLPAAVAAAANQTPLPVELDAAHIGRYGQEVEATVYFTVLEALRATARTRPGHVGIRLTADDDQLTASIAHHDPADPTPPGTAGLTHAQDRITALDGDLHTTTAANTITLTAQVPVSTRAASP